MINRVTHQTVQRSTLANLQVSLGKMSDLQSRMSSGKVITKPSDDPAGTAKAMQLRSDKRSADQFSRNAADGQAWLTTVDTALQASVTALRSARDLTVQGANSGALNPTAREGIAVAIDGVRDAMLQQANTTHLGRPVFAGTTDQGVAFSVTPPVAPATTPTYTWTGTAGASVERRVSRDSTIRVDSDGAAVFGQGGTSVFALLDTISSALRSGADVSGYLTDIDGHLTTMLGGLASVGTRTNQVTTAQSAIGSTVVDLRSELSSVEDIDMAQTIVELQMQEVAYKGALGATQRVLQPSLMDFLR
ncbi:MAG TPA: flagellar hook-associated protein FlgL [Actinotalea sp.]